MMGKLEDSYRHKGLRAKLVEEISRKGITDERVLAAIGKVPRHLFMESGFINFSYKDSAFPIGAGQTISQPYTVAFQTQLLEVWPMDKVLEIGTGSGYQTAVLLEMGARVYTIERQRELYLKSKALLEQMGYNPHFFYGDGYQGKPSYGPYAKILITAAAPEIPQALVDQLEVGGRMVLPLGDTMGQDMTLVEKISPTETRVTAHGRFIFVPMLKGTQR
ncbi:MAG: protein-L-isoaspartate(D-aspartate) O-methyltransferase [Tenuifilaceae bacterium]|jgi:protein-L-isoaspartate(D-aspartate) O-methyltransferase|nr:protein-L-isoaspartate(D-aspartate) O-methyltransferase [Bacteroidota bacterium]OQC62631.1 MAG: Protein-L-isoaspartate O-methyltransferase [Bacteroidetes bacterium ADurb.Bin008]HOF92364.1 protein-L-isoaspartate(D-aspartate) O-methyltransferase [Tenuifilaceae bacterium]HOM86218.1 protein-L-isoaspartate(D-aspartate) O-methyltransferase [Tenuifilaceae bacterium]HOQ35915.1 protein-L-isoaspartate(D-aspartate) O-methyltransferase [Tenuifilaceae bacterium]